MMTTSPCALARGDAQSALEAVERHERTFPAGLLGEERDALRILALVRADRSGEARARTESFRARHPRSFLLHRIEQAQAMSNP